MALRAVSNGTGRIRSGVRGAGSGGAAGDSTLTLSIPFTAMSSMADLTAKGFTFTSPGGGQYRNASGALVTAAANEPRFDHTADGAPLGLIIDTGELLSTTDLSWYTQSAGTWFAEVAGVQTTGYGIIAALGTDQAYPLYYDVAAVRSYNGGQVLADGAPASNMKVAAAGDTVSRSLSYNGGAAVTDGFALTIGTLASKLTVGSQAASNLFIAGHIKSLAFYNVRKSDTELQALTT